MKIGEAAKISPLIHNTNQDQRKDDQGGSERRQRTVKDQTTLAGIPEGEFTVNVRDAVMSLMGQVENLRGELDANKKRVEELENMADEDPLLPLLNRRAFERELSRSISFANRYQSGLSVLYFDLNNFKQINDRYGHDVGDVMLQHVSKILLENVRTSDIVGRLGGDEFVVALIKADLPQAEDKKTALLDTFKAHPIEIDGHTLHVTVATGVAQYKQGDDAASLLRRADLAMYDHKHKIKALAAQSAYVQKP